MSRDEVDRHIGAEVHALLWARRLTQRRLAEQLGIGETNVSKMLRGKRRWTIVDLYLTASLLGIDPDALLPPDLHARLSTGRTPVYALPRAIPLPQAA